MELTLDLAYKFLHCQLNTLLSYETRRAELLLNRPLYQLVLIVVPVM